ncbi:MAG: NAD(P)/FAD-dependent oxidoreductase [Chloroflexi bacterium]|nr:NAD(P)/FAD-dependent oxidoreductase [Chloroflexota bacterium]
MDYDVIIAGGSFAGLAAAVQLHGKRVLLIEPHAIGAVQTSACGTLLAVLEATGTMDSLLQIHDRFVIHLEDRPYEFPLPYPFCTFDYRTFCDRLFRQTDAELLNASVLGHQSHLVYTTKGVFDAEILIDATGWRAALAANGRQQAEPHTGKSFGLETVIPVEKQGLHFYYDKRKLGAYNVGWLFPTDGFSRAGFGSYRGATRLNAALNGFVRNYFGCSSNGIHGGYWPYHRQPAATGHVFRIGDAAGQCIPLSGEGIRPALYFGAMAGSLARRALNGEMRVSDALHIYREASRKRLAIPHYLLLAAQKIIPGLPMRWLDGLTNLVHSPDVLDPLLRCYWNVIDPDALALLWPGDSTSMKFSSRLHVQSDLVYPGRRVL